MLHFFTKMATDITELASLRFSFVCLNQSILLYADNTATNQPANVRGFYFSNTNKSEKMCILCYDAIMLLSEMLAWNWLRRKYRGNVKNGV